VSLSAGRPTATPVERPALPTPQAKGALRAKLIEWLRRYSLPEACGILTAFAGYYLVRAGTGDAVASAYGGALGENVGFYGSLVAREIWRDRRAKGRYGWGGLLSTFAALGLEFGVAEAFDSLLLRPLFMGLATDSLGDAGLLAGKLAADITFYLPAIISYEVRQSMRSVLSTQDEPTHAD
jgi:hypothetical protein